MPSLYTDPGQAAVAARQMGADKVLRILQDGNVYYVPTVGSPAKLGLPPDVMGAIAVTGEEIRKRARRGAISGVPILLGGLVGAMLDATMPWGRGYGPILGAIVGNAVREGAEVGAVEGPKAGAMAFAGASLPILPLALFGWGVDLTASSSSSPSEDGEDEPDTSARWKIAAAAVGLGSWALLDRMADDEG